MSSKLRLNYTYYNCPDIFQQIVEWYLGFDPNGDLFDYTVIDDGSHSRPLKAHHVPEHWNILRINIDYGWNNEGARNCLMKFTDNDWNLLLDCDWVVDEKNLKKLAHAADVEMLDEGVVYMPANYGPKTMRNSFLVHKDEFKKRGGYDQNFIGYHGVDYSFLRFGLVYDHTGWFEFNRIVDDVVPPAEKERAEEIERFHKHMDNLARLGLGHRNKEDKQDFVWKDEETKMELWQDIEYEIIR
tara:strand:- start:8821 stop:9546 length:726 start_codon:yes stop_codon:yes gene_type:complete